MAIMRYAFDELGLERLDTDIIEYNAPSLGLYAGPLRLEPRRRAQQGVLPQGTLVGQGPGRHHARTVSRTRGGDPLLGMRMELGAFERRMAEDGFAIFDGVVPPGLLEALRRDIPGRIAVCGEWQRRNGLAETIGEGAAHHVVGGDDSLADFLEQVDLDAYIRHYFGGEFILNSYGAIDNLPHSERSYAHGQRFHRDVRTYSGDFRLMLNMLVMVDDFTLENGATKVVPGSHRVPERPSDEEIERRTARLTGRAGSIVLFDSNLWHSAAPNLTSGPRKALTLTFSRPFFKQQMDYPRLLGEGWPRNERLGSCSATTRGSRPATMSGTSRRSGGCTNRDKAEDDAAMRNYDQEFQDNTLRQYAYDFDSVVRKYMMRTLSPFFPRDGRALEIGCYEGESTRLIGDHFRDLTVLEALRGTDRSRARQRPSRHPLRA